MSAQDFNNHSELRWSHDSGCRDAKVAGSVPWSDVEQSGGRPVIYSAEGSHASYPSAGEHAAGFPGVNDRTGHGAAWNTWGNLRNVRDEPWYGYGGTWGEVDELKDTTGPLGPSRYKGGAPSTRPPRCA